MKAINYIQVSLLILAKLQSSCNASLTYGEEHDVTVSGNFYVPPRYDFVCKIDKDVYRGPMIFEGVRQWIIYAPLKEEL